MPRENMALSPEDVPGSSVATRESALRSIALCAWLVVDGERSRERGPKSYLTPPANSIVTLVENRKYEVGIASLSPMTTPCRLDSSATTRPTQRHSLALMTRCDRVGYTGGFCLHTYMYMHMCM
jgi:hypothetical protein